MGVPSTAGIARSSGGRCPCPEAVISGSSNSVASASPPSVRRNVVTPARSRDEKVSTNISPSGATVQPCTPGSRVRRSTSPPSSPTRYRCRSIAPSRVPLTNTLRPASSTSTMRVTTHSPEVSCCEPVRSASYRYRCRKPLRSLDQSSSPDSRKRKSPRFSQGSLRSSSVRSTAPVFGSKRCRRSSVCSRFRTTAPSTPSGRQTTRGR